EVRPCEFFPKHPPLSKLEFQIRFPILGEQIEYDVNRRMGYSQFLDATCSGMQAQLQFVERKCALDRNHHFAVENELLLRQLCNISDNIGKITRQRLSVF